MSQIPLVSIPDNWKIERLDRLFQIRNEPARIDDPPVSAFIDGTVTLRSNRPDAIIKGSGQEIGYKHVEIGDLVISGMNAHLGGLGISDSAGKCTPVYTVMEKTIDLDSRFISYYLWHAAKSGYIKSLVNAVRYNSADFGPETIKRFMVPVPPIEEQRRIAKYLDSQLHSVRMMISKTEALATSLSQERLTKISSLVTSGSSDSRKSFGSDIDDWIKFKRKEWNLLPLKHLVSLDNSGVWGEDPGVLDLDVPVATTAHLTRTNTFLVDQMPIRSLTLNDFRKYVCKSGDLIVVKSSGSSDNIMSGKVCVVGDYATKFAFSNFLMRLRPHDASLSRFLQAFLSSHVGVERVKRMVSVTTYPNLRVEEYMNSLIPVPPENEIRQLNETIEYIEKQYSAIIEKIQQSLENLRQYESALVSELVTGSVSVPNKREEVNA